MTRAADHARPRAPHAGGAEREIPTPPAPGSATPMTDAAISRALDLRSTRVPYLHVARRAMDELFGPAHERRFAVRYWSGAVDRPADGWGPPFTIVLRAPWTLRRMFWPPTELALTEAFVRGDVDVEGDLAAAAEIAPLLAERLRSPRRLGRLAALLLQLPGGPPRAGAATSPTTAAGADGLAGRRHSRARDASAIRRHYDVGNDFYGLWLDAERVYSCGYFPTGDEDIHAAQWAKLDLICRKLRLQPGERLLDIGCGWGGLVRHAARHYGIEALGITLSPAQAEYAVARIADEGMTDRCRVEVRDYRDLPADAVFDKVASVGMFEHVGHRQLPTYFRAALRLTRPGGLFLNHGIVSLADACARDADGPPRRLWGKGKFLDRYVFPDGELVPLAAALVAAESAGFETRDVESLREHYALTLRHWVRRLEARADDAVRLVGATTYRVWRLYMAASAHAFATAQIGVAQMLLARPDAAGGCRLPRTRAHLFASSDRAASHDGAGHALPWSLSPESPSP